MRGRGLPAQDPTKPQEAPRPHRAQTYVAAQVMRGQGAFTLPEDAIAAEHPVTVIVETLIGAVEILAIRVC